MIYQFIFIKDFIPKRDDFSVLLVPTLHEVNGQQIVKAIYNKDEVNHLLLLALIINQGRYAVVEMASSASADESLPEDLSQDNINEITQSTTGKLFEVIVGGIQVDEPTGPMPLETGENRQDRLWNIGFETFYRYTSPEKLEIKILTFIVFQNASKPMIYFKISFKKVVEKENGQVV